MGEFDIAIVGMACRVPGARDVAAFWSNLAGGVESIARLTDREILDSGVPASYLGDPSYVKAAPVLDQPGAFDATFFGFSPMEARTMDPQHRLLLELAHEALEDAGCDPQRYAGRVGVFAGAAMNTYLTSARLHRRLAQDYIPTLIVNDKDFLSTRISYKLNLKGPSITVQTACSTSLVAVHLARQSLLSGETDMALAGAVSVRVPHRAGYFADAGGVTSPDGRVRAFDAKANGTVFGSGGGVVVMKRLADAIRDGDPIRAIIKGSAVNNDGSEKAGYTAPSVNSQADCVVEALANAGVEPDSVSYIEAHGSGTPVGDPIEVAALTKAFRASTARSGFCAIGSVKTNVGHLDAAAGMAGLIKTVLALEHRQLPASLHYSEPNPEIDFPSTPFHVNSRLVPWESGAPRRAGIMSTGMGGTNAHLVLEEAPVRTRAAGSGAASLLVLSARTATALDAASERLRAFLKSDAPAEIEDVAFTLQTGRRAFAHRRYLVCADRADAVAGLAPNSKRTGTSHVGQSRRPLVLLLPGVGDHYLGMGHDLYCRFDAFRSALDQCAAILEPQLGTDIRTILYPEGGAWKSKGPQAGIDLRKMLGGKRAEADSPESRTLNETRYTQPAQFAVEYALARLWADFGVVPDAIVGHSMGEYVAACLAGVLSLEDALRLIVRRTQLVDRLPRGRMLAVALPEEEIAPLLDSRLSICLINGPSLCVVAGADQAVEQLEHTVAAKGVISRAVQNTHAFHSRLLDPIIGEFESEVRKVALGEPRIPYVSNVTGTWITKAQAMDPRYWASHTNRTARFNDALRALWRLSDAPILLEAGPGKTLGVLAMQHPERKAAGTVVSSMRHHYENRNDVEFLLHAVGGLWASGMDISWDRVHQGAERRKVALPTYPFERQEYWFTPDDAADPHERPARGAEPVRAGVDPWFYTPVWERAPQVGGVGQVPPDRKASWLIVSDRRGTATAFQKSLQESGVVVQVARFGERFARRNDGSFEINPAAAQDYLKLFRDIKGSIRDSLNILHLGCLAPGEDQERGFFSVLRIAQAIGELGISIPIRMGIVSSRIHEVTGGEVIAPGMATVLGPAGVMPKELPNIACFSVDLETEDPQGDTVAQLLREFAEPPRGEVLAYRGKYRWKRKYEAVNLPESAVVPRVLRQRGVYLITGGTGGLGLEIARLLANACKARIVLTRKTAFPERSRWKELVGSERTPEPTRRTIQQLLEVENAGAEVEVFTAEASDEAQMRRVVGETLRRFGTINGVFHAAGIVRAGLMQAKADDTAASVLSPKVRGTLLLHDLLAGVDLDFLVLFSSITSVIYPYAESDYAGANSFLDAFAPYSNARRKYRTVSINWPGWKETGQLASLETRSGTERWKQHALDKAILTRDGLEALKRILDCNLAQVVVSPENLQLLIAESTQAFDPEQYLRTGDAGPGVHQAAGDRLADEDRPRSEIETTVADIWCAVFGVEPIGIHQEFSALGGHSLIAMQIVARVRSFYRIDLSLREFFAAATIARLSAEVEGKILREIESLSDDEAGQLARAFKAERAS